MSDPEHGPSAAAAARRPPFAAVTDVCRFAPTTSGPAHPGTLLAALLAWLDARSRGAPFQLRLEDLDPQRTTAERGAAMQRQLRWLGLDWDALVVQSEQGPRHRAALESLASRGRLYPCACSRKDVRARGERNPLGGWRYPGTCRGAALPADWWDRELVVRLRLDPGVVELRDESGAELSHDPEATAGDPIVRRRDGAVAYHVAVVVDDAAAGVGRIVRGRDLATAAPVQVVIHRLLDLPVPAYRHHLLLWDATLGGKLSKSHHSVGADELAEHGSPAQLCGFLAWVAGLQERNRPATPADLLPGFAWPRVRAEDQVVRWDGEALRWMGAR